MGRIIFGDPQMTKLDEARDALAEAEKSLSHGGWSLAGQLIIKAVGGIADEFAKLSPAPVGEAKPPCDHAGDWTHHFAGDGSEGTFICERCGEDLGPSEPTTPPAEDSDGGEDRLLVDVLEENDILITDLRQRLAEARTTIENLNVEVAEYQRRDADLYREHAAEAVADRKAAESALTDARKRIGALEAGLRPFAKIVGSSLYAKDGSDGDKYRIYLANDAGPHDFSGADVERARALLTAPASPETPEGQE